MVGSNKGGRARVGVAAVIVLALTGACGGDDSADEPAATSPASQAPVATEPGSDDTVPAATAPADTTGTTDASDAPVVTAAPEPVECTGDPIKLTAIGTQSGPLAFPSVARDFDEGLTAALTAVNSTCEAGRPIDVTICDDKSDPNESTACGRAAQSDGSLAIFGAVGNLDGGVTTAGLPGVLAGGAGQWDLTNPMSYPSGTAVTLILGSISAAAAAGAETYLMVAFDSPVTQFLVSQVQALAAQLGVEMESLFFPPDTTDFAPIAAQVATRDPDSIGIIVTSVIPFINAMDAEGISPLDTPMFTAVGLIPPDVIQELGSKVDGFYLISGNVPAQDTENPGIQQMLAEYEAAGIDTPVADIGAGAVDIWSKVHILAGALSALEPAELESLDSQGLVDAVLALGRVDRPEYAPFDLNAPAFPENPALSTMRIFSREALAVRVENGTYVAVSPFGDVTVPFEMDFPG